MAYIVLLHLCLSVTCSHRLLYFRCGRFLVTKKIYVAGFGVYGSIHGSAEYSATIELLSGDTQRVLASNDSTFTCDGSSSTFRVMFKEPVEVQPWVHYIGSVTLKVSLVSSIAAF